MNIATAEKLRLGLNEIETSIKLYKDAVCQEAFAVQLLYVKSLLDQLVKDE